MVGQAPASVCRLRVPAELTKEITLADIELFSALTVTATRFIRINRRLELSGSAA